MRNIHNNRILRLSLTEYLRTALSCPQGVPGIIMTLQTFGEYLDFHPHIRALDRFNAKINRNFEVFTATDFLAAITQHIPDKGVQMVRYYGWYSNKMRGVRHRGLPPGLVPHRPGLSPPPPLPVDVLSQVWQDGAAMNESENQFSLTRAALSTGGRAKAKFLSFHVRAQTDTM